MRDGKMFEGISEFKANCVFVTFFKVGKPGTMRSDVKIF